MQLGATMKFKTLFVTAVFCIGLSATVQAQRPAAINTAPRPYGDNEFRLGPEDVIEVSVYQDKELSTTVPIRPDGKISVPLVGEIPASGKTATELQKEITHKYSQFIADPAVTIVVKEVNSPKVSVLGEVKNPGMFKIKDRATVLDAIAMAGGLTEYAKKDKVTVIRVDGSGELLYLKINLEDQIKGRRSDPFYVQPYDKIYIQ
jgi:polysaccharide export outer membrane protein